MRSCGTIRQRATESQIAAFVERASSHQSRGLRRRRARRRLRESATGTRARSSATTNARVKPNIHWMTRRLALMSARPVRMSVMSRWYRATDFAASRALVLVGTRVDERVVELAVHGARGDSARGEPLRGIGIRWNDTLPVRKQQAPDHARVVSHRLAGDRRLVRLPASARGCLDWRTDVILRSEVTARPERSPEVPRGEASLIGQHLSEHGFRAQRIGRQGEADDHQ